MLRLQWELLPDIEQVNKAWGKKKKSLWKWAVDEAEFPGASSTPTPRPTAGAPSSSRSS